MFIGWKEPRPVDMAAGDVIDQGPERRGAWRRLERPAQAFRGGETAGQQAHGGALHVTFDPCHLAGEAEPRLGLEPEAAIQKARAVEEGVAVQAAKPREDGLLKPGDHPEDLGLGTMLQLGLEAHHVPERTQGVVLPQLDDSPGLLVRTMGVCQADRLHGPMPQGLAPTLGHHLDGQAAVEIGNVLPFPELGFRPGQEGVDEGLVLVPVHGAVDVGLSVAPGPALS